MHRRMQRDPSVQSTSSQLETLSQAMSHVEPPLQLTLTLLASSLASNTQLEAPVQVKFASKLPGARATHSDADSHRMSHVVMHVSSQLFSLPHRHAVPEQLSSHRSAMHAGGSASGKPTSGTLVSAGAVSVGRLSGAESVRSSGCCEASTSSITSIGCMAS